MTGTEYIFNLETTKIELHFDKADYSALPEEQKKKLKSAFLFSGKGKCWVSRAKEPNLYHAKQVAAELGFTEEQREGERLTYAEQLERQAERAEERAERYEGYAANAGRRAETLQKPIAGMRGDIAFFTQPILAGHSGSQAFARRREQMFESYAKGFEEYRKSEYFRDRADIARSTADMAKLQDKGYLDRRIKECRKTIRQHEKNVMFYETQLAHIENGQPLTRHDGTLITITDITGRLEREFELIAVERDKEGFFLNCLDELGGVAFSSDNIKAGYRVLIKNHGLAEVISKGPQNITYKKLTGGAAGMILKAAYAEIESIETTAVSKETHPFKIGETFKVCVTAYDKRGLNSLKATTSHVIYEIVKTSDTTIQLREQGTANKPVVRRPKKVFSGAWAFSFDEHYSNTFYKQREA